MRVAFAQCYTDDRRDMAWARRLRRVAEQLAGRGHDVTVYCARWWDDPDGATERNRVRYRAVIDDPDSESFAPRLAMALRSASPAPDVIHVTATEPWTVLSARAVGTVRRIPVIADWYGEEPGGPDATGRRWRAAVRAPTALIVPSRFVETSARELGASAERTHVIPESIDTDLIDRLDPAGDADIVYSRWLDDTANLEPVLLALAELRDRDWRATVIGDGPKRSAYETQARDLRIDDRVTFAGALPLPHRVARFKQAHVFVQTARRCPFATELLWALASGCVGVVEYQSDSSAHELVEGHPRGFRSTGDEELADAIAAAAERPRLTADDSFDAYDHDAVLERYLSLYREVMGLGG